MCGKSFCSGCYEGQHGCNKEDVENEKLKLQNKDTPILPLNPFFLTPFSQTTSQTKPTLKTKGKNDTTIQRKSLRVFEEHEDEEDSDYVPREKKDVETSSGDENEDDDSEYSGLEGSEAREAYVKKKLGSGLDKSKVVAEKHHLGSSRQIRKRNRGKGLQRHTTVGVSEPKHLSPALRIREFATEPFELNVQHPNRLFCTACLTVVSLKKTAITDHIETKKHKACKDIQSKQVSAITKFTTERDRKKLENNECFTVTTPISIQRMKVCVACLKDGVPFELFNDPMPKDGIRYLLQENRCVLPYRELRDLVPDVILMMDEELIEELKKAINIGITFDGTPHIAEVFGVIFRFLKADRTTQRLAALKFYNKSFNKEQLATALMDIMEHFGVKRNSLRSCTSDGCPVNHAAVVSISIMYNQMTDVTCISHSSNCVGKQLLNVLPLAKRLQEKWSNMIEVSHRARQLFIESSNHKAFRGTEVRWYCWYEICKQIYDDSGAVDFVINHEDDFSESLRDDMKLMITPENKNDLRMELAIAKDCGRLLVLLCYYQEGDAAFLCTTTYDHWYSTLDFLREVTSAHVDIDMKRFHLPSVVEIAESISDIVHTQNQYIFEAATKLVPVYEYMLNDSHNRLGRTLRILRSCRLFHPLFIANQNIDALEEEIVHLQNIHVCVDITVEPFNLELEEYKRLAQLWCNHEMTEHDVKIPVEKVEDFWLRNAINIPNWFRASRQILLISPS
jgi:hypothetical protein